MKKGLWVTVAALLMMVSLSACGGNSFNENNNNEKTNNTASGKEEVELRVMWWGDQKRADLTNQVLRKFEEKNPNIKVVGEFAPSSGYFDKLNTQLASGTAPDVFFLGGNVVDYNNKGVLLSLDPYVDKVLDLKDMDTTMIEYGTLDQKLVHVSAGANARGIVVNTALFSKAGIPIPEGGWTWDEFAEISKSISDKLGKDYYGTYDFTVDGMDIGLKQHGKMLYDMEAGAPGFEELDVKEWFQFWADMNKNGGVVKPTIHVSNPPGDTSKSLIITGKVAMSLIPSNQLVALQNLTQDKLVMVEVPRGEKGTAIAFESSQGLSGYAKTEHPEEVAKLMNFFINDADAALILGNDRGVPVTSKMRDLLKKDADSVQQIIYDYLDKVSGSAKKEPVKVSYNPPGFTEYTKLAETTLQEIAFGRKDVPKAAEDFYKGVVKIFEINKNE